LIQVSTTDIDVVQRAADLFGTKLAVLKNKTGKPMFGAKVSGATAVGWMMTLYSLMGERRKEKIREVLARWRATPGYPRAVLSAQKKLVRYKDLTQGIPI
jgi:hypothetical protein